MYVHITRIDTYSVIYALQGITPTFQIFSAEQMFTSSKFNSHVVHVLVTETIKSRSLTFKVWIKSFVMWAVLKCNLVVT